MNRRTFLRAAGVCGGVSTAGCLGSEAETDIDSNENTTAPRYTRATYSEWPPDTSHDGGGVLFANLQLGQYPGIQDAINEGRLDSAHPVVGLAVYGSEQIATAVETLSAYPFGDTLRQATVAASTSDRDAETDHNQTLVDPLAEPLSPRTNSSDGGVSEPEDTEIDGESTQNETTDNESTDNETADSKGDKPITAADLGIELDSIALFDEVLLFEGSFDHAQIVDRFGQAFEQVDTHRGVSIYEGTDEMDGFAFALTSSRLLVPTVETSRSVDGETVLAHSLSRYISTVDRIVDTADGQWLFGTTGQPALSVGFWETPMEAHLAASTVATGRPGVDAVFESVGSCLSAVAVSDEDATTPAYEARFSGLYPAGPPSDADLRSALVADIEPAVVFSEPPRVHVSTPLSE